MNQPIVTNILQFASRHPDKPAIIHGDAITTYGTLANRIQGAANKLRATGIQPGDRIILAAAKSPSFVYGYFATHLLGAIALPVDPEITDKNLAYIIDQTTPKALFIARDFAYGSLTAIPIDTCDAAPTATSTTPAPPDLQQTADILFTTGTTGQKKGVVLTHANILAAAININTFIGNTADDREVLPLPLSHSFGLGRLRCNMLAGGTLILVDGFLKARQIFTAFEKWHATGFCFVPAGLQVLFRLSGDKLGNYAAHLKYIEIGSAPMPRENKERLMRLLPQTRICMHYGLTEASRAAFIEFHADKEHLDSIGKPSPNVAMAIRNEQRENVPDGDIGRIHVKGGQVMQTYWQNREETAKTLQDGWLDTGDVGYRQDGYLYLKGRYKDIINIGGRKVAPDEIEELLRQHPAIEDCACIGIQDPENITGESIKAFICLRPGPPPSPEDLTQFLRDRLETYKLPRLYEIIDQIPKTASGKLQRQLLPR